MLGLFFVIIFLELPEPWHKDKTKAKINRKTNFGQDLKFC
jgi:hypothetical protein